MSDTIPVNSSMPFPTDFVWGCASASYQIEGAPAEDGKGPSIWDTFSHQPGAIAGGFTGDVACDAYHRLEEDLDLMQELGIPHYRFSISWPRILPSGRLQPSPLEGAGTSPAGPLQQDEPADDPGAGSAASAAGAGTGAGINAAGLAYYDRVVDGCLARGITPWITLYHWDLPQALETEGGWQNRQTAYDFAVYARIVANHFAGRVRNFITINEPQIAIGMGYGTGQHAPGLQLNAKALFACWHHLLLAHGLAAQEIREAIPDANIGVSSTGTFGYIPDHPQETPQELSRFTFTTQASGESHTSDEDHTSGEDHTSAEDRKASEQDSKFSGTIDTEGDAANDDALSPAVSNFWFNHQWFLDPVCEGHYPDDPASPWAAFAQTASDGDLALIHQPPDFIGLNIYNGTELDPATGYQPAPKYPGYPRTSLKWPVTPPVLYWGPRLIWERYGLPVCITENGQGCYDRIYRDGGVHDADRIDFLETYLEELGAACADSVPVLGYFHWSFTDNLEWHSGYDDRFGLIYIDYRSQRRIPKDSARWYAGFIAANRLGMV